MSSTKFALFFIAARKPGATKRTENSNILVTLKFAFFLAFIVAAGIKFIRIVTKDTQVKG
jgi:hypothetical protein